MLYNAYANRIKDIVAKNQQRKSDMFKGQTIGAISGISNDARKLRFQEQKEFSSRMQLDHTDLMTIVASTPLHNAALGLHPDFSRLRGTAETENHWIISVFADIKGSTNLFRDFDLVEIYNITNTIQAAMIHTIIALGGHIQRLEGDGVLAYFGGRNMNREDAVRKSMIACSFISYFVENDLKALFRKDGIEEISTRIGIDFGDDEDTLWANFGVEHISELTTLSLHTSLASKMQGYARANGIVAGDHIKVRMPGQEDFFKIISDNDRYIFRDKNRNFLYTQWAFNWFGFLKKQPFIGVNRDGSLYMVKPGAPAIITSPSNPPLDYSGLAALASTNVPHCEGYFE